MKITDKNFKEIEKANIKDFKEKEFQKEVMKEKESTKEFKEKDVKEFKELEKDMRENILAKDIAPIKDRQKEHMIEIPNSMIDVSKDILARPEIYSKEVVAKEVERLEKIVKDLKAKK